MSGPRRRVVKFGSAILTRDGEGLDAPTIQRFAAALAALPGELVVVSSGAVAAGLNVLGHRQRPEALAELQAAAAVGQMGLIQAWERAFARHGRHTASILLTHEDVSDRTRYLNARNTLRTLLGYGVVPIINENDTVATDEIRFGDNDTLAALVSNLVEADLLALVTDIDGLHEADPRQVPGARRVAAARASDEALDAMVGPPAGRLGRGGMATKLRAARLAARAGAGTLLIDGRGDAIEQLQAPEGGTLLVPDRARLVARKRWIAGQLQTRGELVLDAGAVRVLREAGRSLLPVGVLAVRGRFARGEVVTCRDESGAEVARGLVNYSSDEAARICGCASNELALRLGYAAEPELVHRDNLVLA
ncbi:MAG: glutamate 5-kinase [Pseudomonadales bacterium]|nr:glutamate 5-kinase [Pseudomonadales bacterium]